MIVFTHNDCLKKFNGQNHPESKERLVSVINSLKSSSELKINSTGNEKLINLCKYFEADNFIVKKNTENYHPIELFQKQDIKFKYIEYDQVQSNDKLNFKPDMSIVDYACYNKNLT